MLIATISVMVFVLLMAFFANNEVTRMTYLGMFAGSLFALPSIFDTLGLYGKKTEEYALLDKKLGEIYSPIHSMIVTIDNEVSRPAAIVGEGFVSADLLDMKRLSEIFRQYAHELGNHHLEMWLSIEKEINEFPSGVPIKRGAFRMNKKRSDWLDQLDVEYQKLVKELDKHKP